MRDRPLAPPAPGTQDPLLDIAGATQAIADHLAAGDADAAARELERLVATAGITARHLRGEPTIAAAMRDTAPPSSTTRPGPIMALLLHGAASMLVGLAGIVEVRWLAGGQRADFPALLDTLQQHAPLSSWHWAPLAAALAALFSAAICSVLDAGARRAWHRHAVARQLGGHR